MRKPLLLFLLCLVANFLYAQQERKTPDMQLAYSEKRALMNSLEQEPEQTVGMLTITAPTTKQVVELEFYPNPVMTSMKIRNAGLKTQVTITNLLGEKLALFSVYDHTEVDLSQLETGTYLIHFEELDKVITRRFIKSN